MTEANQNFSSVARIAEEVGHVIIEKQGKERFAVLSIAEYRKYTGSLYWIKSENGFCRYERDNRNGLIQVVIKRSENDYLYKKILLPEATSKITSYDLIFPSLLKDLSADDSLVQHDPVYVKTYHVQMDEDHGNKDSAQAKAEIEQLIEEISKVAAVFVHNI